MYCTVPTMVPATVTGDAKSAMVAAIVATEAILAEPDFGPLLRPRGFASPKSKSGAKLMDFGLAKPLGLSSGPKSGSASMASVATMAATMADLASPVTVAGTIVGTVQYMSPEQIQGKEADARSDIFAFGALLYEMLTGKRAFEGKSQLSLASAILEKDPDPISIVQPLTPPALEQIVRTCLAKEPDDRFQSAHDLKLQLQWIAAGGSQLGTPAAVASPRKKRFTVLTAALAAGWFVAALAGM